MYCNRPEHERFTGVFFCQNGCLACELEQTAKTLNQAINILQNLYDLQNGCPLPKYEKDWSFTMKQARDLLSRHAEWVLSNKNINE